MILFLLQSCNKGGVSDCFNNTGEITRVSRDVGEFKTIILHDNVNLIISNSESSFVDVEAGANIIDGIETDLNENSVLTIRNNNSCNWIRSYDKPINVYLGSNSFDSIVYRSIGDISTIDTFNIDVLYFSIMEGAGSIKMKIKTNSIYLSMFAGTADVELMGKSKMTYLYSNAFGLIDASNLFSTLAYVNNSSTNNMYVRTSKDLGAIIGGIGDIYYYGDPEYVGLEKTGTGNLIKID